LFAAPAPKARVRRKKKRVGSEEITEEEEEDDQQRALDLYPMDNDNFDMHDVQPMDDDQRPGYIDYSIRESAADTS
jgi:cytidylate kinase